MDQKTCLCPSSAHHVMIFSKMPKNFWTLLNGFPPIFRNSCKLYKRFETILKQFWNRSVHIFHHKLRSIVRTVRLPRLLLHKWQCTRRHVYVPVVPTTLWFFRRCQKNFELFFFFLTGFHLFFATPVNFTKDFFFFSFKYNMLLYSWNIFSLELPSILCMECTNSVHGLWLTKDYNIP